MCPGHSLSSESEEEEWVEGSRAVIGIVRSHRQMWHASFSLEKGRLAHGHKQAHTGTPSGSSGTLT